MCTSRLIYNWEKKDIKKKEQKKSVQKSNGRQFNFWCLRKTLAMFYLLNSRGKNLIVQKRPSSTSKKKACRLGIGVTLIVLCQDAFCVIGSSGRQSPPENLVISIFSGQKPCTRIISTISDSFLHFSNAKDVISRL